MNSIRSALYYAAFIIGAALILKTLEWAGYVSGDPDEIAQRFVQIAVGTMFLWYANRIPKISVAKPDCTFTKEDQIRRFAGRVLVVGGIGYVLAWVISPFDVAAIIAVSILGGAFTLVLGRWVMARLAAG